MCIWLCFAAAVNAAQESREQKREGGDGSEDEIHAGGAGALIDGASEERADDRAEADEDRTADTLGGGADVRGRTLIDIRHTASADEGEADAVENMNGQYEERKAIESDKNEPEGAEDESEDDHAA